MNVLLNTHTFGNGRYSKQHRLNLLQTQIHSLNGLISMLCLDRPTRLCIFLFNRISRVPNRLHILLHPKNSSLQATGDKPVTYASLDQRSYKQINCVRHAVITTLLLLQHDVHSYFVYKHHWPNKAQVVSTPIL